MSKQPPPAPTERAVGPCPTLVQKVRRPGTGSLPSTIAPPDHPQAVKKLYYFEKFGEQQQNHFRQPTQIF